VVVFLLGVLVILDAVIGTGDSLPELIIGTVLVGVLPLEYVVRAWRQPGQLDRAAPPTGAAPPDPSATRPTRYR
jgi:ACR3 family arsenite efflux pump ArsB